MPVESRIELASRVTTLIGKLGEELPPDVANRIKADKNGKSTLLPPHLWRENNRSANDRATKKHK
jgi:hypothetical protein